MPSYNIIQNSKNQKVYQCKKYVKLRGAKVEKEEDKRRQCHRINIYIKRAAAKA